MYSVISKEITRSKKQTSAYQTISATSTTVLKTLATQFRQFLFPQTIINLPSESNKLYDDRFEIKRRIFAGKSSS